MSLNEFNKLKSSLKQAGYDESRLRIAKEAIEQNYILAEQALEIMRTLSFETSRLDFALSAYSKTIDKDKFFIMNQGFHFSSSIEKLNRFINYVETL
jgi:hypothetical protein